MELSAAQECVLCGDQQATVRKVVDVCQRQRLSCCMEFFSSKQGSKAHHEPGAGSAGSERLFPQHLQRVVRVEVVVHRRLIRLVPAQGRISRGPSHGLSGMFDAVEAVEARATDVLNAGETAAARMLLVMGLILPPSCRAATAACGLPPSCRCVQMLPSTPLLARIQLDCGCRAEGYCRRCACDRDSHEVDRGRDGVVISEDVHIAPLPCEDLRGTVTCIRYTSAVAEQQCMVASWDNCKRSPRLSAHAV